tara:strand:- start:195 stop:1235 length:1041 start_codon:yes stop_codon:yes gene_type:complete
MTQNLLQCQWKQWWIASLFFSCVFSVFTLNISIAQAQTVSYASQLEGCRLGGTSSVRPTCTQSVIAYYDATQASCAHDAISELQLVTCTISGEQNGIPRSFTATQQMFPVYTCPYGDIGGRVTDFIPYNCQINYTSTIPVKNFGGGSCPSSNKSSNDTKPYDGNPIHAGIGNKYAIECDYNSVSLEFTRYFNNQLNRFAGIQWRHSYSKRLVFNLNGSDSVTFAERQDGSTLFFTLDNNLWVSDEDISAHLTALQDGSWQLLLADDDTETYDVEGKLINIANRDGRTQTLNYDANGNLTSVSDDTGRDLTFTYDGSNRIATVTDPAGGGVSIYLWSEWKPVFSYLS